MLPCDNTGLNGLGGGPWGRGCHVLLRNSYGRTGVARAVLHRGLEAAPGCQRQGTERGWAPRQSQAPEPRRAAPPRQGRGGGRGDSAAASASSFSAATLAAIGALDLAGQAGSTFLVCGRAPGLLCPTLARRVPSLMGLRGGSAGLPICTFCCSPQSARSPRDVPLNYLAG